MADLDVLAPKAKGRRLVISILEQLAERRPEKIQISYLRTSKVEDGFIDVTHRDIKAATDAFAWWLTAHYGRSKTFETVAYIGLQDARYAMVLYGAIKAGYKLLLFSPKNTAAQNASLLKQTDCKVLLHSAELEGTVKSIVAQGSHDFEVEQLPSFEIWVDRYDRPFEYTKTYEEAKLDPILVLHSSGSTGAPKPIVMPHATFSAIDRPMRSIPGRRFGNAAIFDDLAPGGCAFAPFSPFHAVGIINMCFLTLYSKDVSFITGLIASPPSPQTVLGILKARRPEAVYLPPSLLESITHLEGGLDVLRSSKYIMFAGGPLSDACGNDLKDHVTLCVGYGATEIGMLHMLIPEDPNHWSYLEWHPDYHHRMQPSMDEAHEFIIDRDAPLAEARGCTFNLPDTSEYRTKDMFHRHPDNPNLWKFFGRNDDIIVFSNGLKFNPVPAEGVLLGSDQITGALIVGDGYASAALLLEPKEDSVSHDALMDQIWPYVEKANKISPKQGYLCRPLVAFVEPRGFVRAPKGTVVRSKTRERYTSLIKELYNTAESSKVESTIMFDKEAELGDAALHYVRACVAEICKSTSLEDDADLFNNGLDSVQSSRLVKILKHGLKDSFEALETMSVSNIFENPSISQLATFLRHLLEGDSSAYTSRSASITSLQTTASSADDVEDMISRYSLHLQSYHAVLTGSTGSLGLRVLQTLLSNPRIHHITCLDRDTTARKRIQEALPGMPLSKVTFLTVQYSEPDLGLAPSDLDELRASADLIIHNAWKVDFNHPLSSFESTHVRGVAHLAQLAASSSRKPRLFFVSSISTMANWHPAHPHDDPVTPIPELISDDPAVALPMGYAQSKYVSERLLAAWAREGALRATVLRVGQIAGPTGAASPRGPAWSPAEWFPTLIRSARALRCLPNWIPPADWIPVDLLAGIIADVVLRDLASGSSLSELSRKTQSQEPQALRVYNLTNPHSVQWSEILPTVQTALGGAEEVPAVPLADWIQKVEALDGADEDVLRRVPAVKLLGFYRSWDECKPQVVFETGAARKASARMRALRPVNEAWMVEWVKQWSL